MQNEALLLCQMNATYISAEGVHFNAGAAALEGISVIKALATRRARIALVCRMSTATTELLAVGADLFSRPPVLGALPIVTRTNCFGRTIGTTWKEVHALK